MLPFNKAQWFLGYANLSMMMEQDRKHWLLKTDKNKYEFDTTTGSVFNGTIDNTGTAVVLETSKLPETNTVLAEATFSTENIRKVFSVEKSTLPFSYDVSGLSMCRIVSNLYPYNNSYKPYKIRFTNCELVYVPFSNNVNDNVFAFQFIKTSSNPILLLPDADDQYTIEIPVSFTNLTNVVFYYPLDTFTPIDIVNDGGGTYTTIAITSEDYIGYPMLWFISTETTVGPTFKISSPIDIAHYGSSSENKYNQNIYFGLPDSSIDINDYILRAGTDAEFVNDSSDYELQLKHLYLIDKSDPENPIELTFSKSENETDGKLYMNYLGDEGWEYKNASSYEIELSKFESNSIYSENRMHLIQALRLTLDSKLPFVVSSYDYGYAGLRAYSNNYEFPYDLSKFDGLPERYSENVFSYTNQSLSVYAIHSSEDSIPGNPDTSQTAALLFDPGVPATTSEFTNDNIGRVYLLSNDSAEYKNNAKEEFPKPARTIARICDIPTSLVQLTNISGIAPAPIVDKKYIRSEASYSAKDQNKLYNELSDKWVRPTCLMSDGNPVYGHMTNENNEFVFQTINGLNAVDFNTFNDLRKLENLNRGVNHNDISVYGISNPGRGYSVDETGIIVVGGYSLNYVVSEVGPAGEVLEVSVYGTDDVEINLANFDMSSESGGITNSYGTSSLSGGNGGTGLRIQLKIDNYHDLIPTKGDIRDGLYALVRTANGLWLYIYNTTDDEWQQTDLISSDETSETDQLSTKDSFINSILPQYRSLPISPYEAGKETRLGTVSSGSFINVVDEYRTPVYSENETTKTVVDINKWHCDSIGILMALERSSYEVVAKLKKEKLNRYDAFIIWRWVDDHSRYFEYGVIYRSLNNLLSTDSTSLLPANELYNPYYVNSNPGTTMTWNVEGVGPMVWMYNAMTNITEQYSINEDTNELVVTRKPLRWNEIEVYTNNFQTKVDLVDESGKILWNVITSIGYGSSSDDPIYKHPDYQYVTPYILIGTDVSNMEFPAYTGCWQLVFPRVHSFTFKNTGSNVSYNPIKMNLIRGAEVSDSTVIIDESGANVNYKTCVIDSSNGLNIYDKDTATWVKI